MPSSAVDLGAVQADPDRSLKRNRVPRQMTNKKNEPFLVCLDRDGTLIEDKGYLADPDGVLLYPRAARAIRLLRSRGAVCAVTTNQSGVARGYLTREDAEAVNARTERLLAAQDAAIDRTYVSYGWDGTSDPQYLNDLPRRKPRPGMAREARRDFDLPDAPLFSIGDKMSDVELGFNAGGMGLLVRTGEGETHVASLANDERFAPSASDVYDAACAVLLELAKARFPGDEVMARKLYSPGQLRPLVDAHKLAGRKVVLANGCFDLLHGGHVSFLEGARECGDLLVLAVNSNESIARLKGEGRPLLPEPARLQLLAALEAVDYLTVFHTDSADEAIRELHPSAHAKGTDYRVDSVPEGDTSRELGIEIVIAGDPKENSTRDIIETVRARTAEGVL